MACSAQLLLRGLPGKQVRQAAAWTITILECAVTYLICWYFLLLHKANLGDLGTTSYPFIIPSFRTKSRLDRMKNIWRGARQWVSTSLTPQYMLHVFPIGIYRGDTYFLQILKLLSGYFQWTMHNFTQNYTVLSQETLLRLDAYVWLSYFLTALFHRSVSLLETHHLTGLITQSLKWCIPYIYSILLQTHSFFFLSVWKKKSRISLLPGILQGPFFLDLPLSFALADSGSWSTFLICK